MTNIFKEYSKLNDVFENLDKTTTRSVINAFNKTSLSVDELSDKFGGLDVSTKEYLSTSKRGEASMSGLKSNIDNSATSMGFATIKAKALSIALNALTGLAITLAVKGIVWAFDELVTTLNEQKEKLEDSISAYEDSKTELESINDELKTTSDRIDELNGKDNLTFTEQDELDKLVKTNDELERKIYLLEQANKEAEKDVANEAQNTYKKFTNDRTIGAVDQIDFYTNSSLLEGVNWDNHKDDLSWLVAQYQKQQEVLNNAQENGWANIEEQAKSNITLLEGYMSDASLSYQDLYDTISDISDVSMTPELESAKTDLDDILDIVAEILGYGGQRAETSFDEIWDSKDFEKSKNDLLSLAKSGELTPETLTSNEEYQKLLDSTGKTAEETAEHINALAVAEEDAKNAAGEGTPLFSKTDFSSTISNLGKVQKILQEVQSNADNKVDLPIDISDIEALREEFGSLGKVYEDFENTLGSTNSYEDKRESINNLVSAYLDEKLSIEGSTQAEQEFVAGQLESVGVQDSMALVQQKVAEQTEAVTLQKQLCAQTGKELSAVTVAEANGFLQHATASDTAKQYLIELIFEEQVFSNQDLDLSGKISKLGELAAAYGQTELAAKVAAQEEQNKAAHTGSVTNKDIENYRKMLKEGLSTGINVKVTPVAKSGSSKSNKEKEKEVDILAELNSELDKIQDAYTKLIDIRDTFNKTGKITIDQYQELTNMGYNFLAQLVDENGALNLNEAAFKSLADAKSKNCRYSWLVMRLTQSMD